MRGLKPQLTAIEGGLSKVPPVPKGMLPEGREEWRRVAKQLIELNALREADLKALEHYAIAAGMVKKIQPEANEAPPILVSKSGAVKTHPAHTMLTRYLSIVKQYEAELGLTPVSRGRKAIRKGSEPNEGAPPGLDL